MLRTLKKLGFHVLTEPQSLEMVGESAVFIPEILKVLPVELFLGSSEHFIRRITLSRAIWNLSMISGNYFLIAIRMSNQYTLSKYRGKSTKAYLTRFLRPITAWNLELMPPYMSFQVYAANHDVLSKILYPRSKSELCKAICSVHSPYLDDPSLLDELAVLGPTAEESEQRFVRGWTWVRLLSGQYALEAGRNI